MSSRQVLRGRASRVPLLLSAVTAILALVLGGALLAPAPATAAWPVIYLRTAYTGLSAPLFVTGDGTGQRTYIVERAGRIMVAQGASSATSVFLDIRSSVSTVGERGLLGLAFSPQYAVNGRFYVYYVDAQGLTHLARFTRDPGDPNKAVTGSEVTLLSFPRPYTNHNGGWIGFGPDGYLYVASGDGGGGGDPQGNGQKLSTLLGKMLRLDTESGAMTYSIPPDNPFVGVSGAKPEIWAYGLRNPWRCSFDSAGRLYIADVGQNTWEEINIAAPGAAAKNYGWNRYEGNHPYPIDSTATSKTGLTFPVIEHKHPTFESITGGYLYEGAAYPRLSGTYFYGDFEWGTIYGLQKSGSTYTSRLLLDTTLLIPSFGENDAGDLFVTGLANGNVYEVQDAGAYTTRIAGADRFSAAVNIAKFAWPAWGGVTDVIIASGDTRAAADPLAANGLSWAYNGAPLLLVSAASTPASVRTALAEIRAANGPLRLHVAGGTSSVPAARVNELLAAAGPGSTADRVLATGDRYDLAAAIAARMKSLRPGDWTGRVLIANGADSSTFFDALSLAPVSAATGAPVLLVTRTTVPTATSRALSTLGVPVRYLAGGTGTVNAAVATKLKVGAISLTRLWGPNRYSTSTAIADKAIASGWLTPGYSAVVGAIPDAVSGGAALGHLGGVVLATHPTTLQAPTRSYFATRKATITEALVLGGTGSVSDQIRRDIAGQLD